MRRHITLNSPCERYRRVLAAFTLACFCLSGTGPAFAGGYVDGAAILNPARAVNTGGISVTPTFNNDQFNDQLLVGTVNNDPIRTPSTADPVSTVTGNNFHDKTDLFVRGRNDFHYAFTRTYNSAPSSTKVDRGLGYGWTHSYLMRLKSNDFGDCPNCNTTQRPDNANGRTSSVTYTDERGAEQSYLVNETSFVVTAPKGVYDTLSLNTPVAGQHTLSFRNGTSYVFETPTGDLRATPNVVARLKFIDNIWGDRLTFSYDASGRLSTVVDNLAISGRTGLLFSYHPDGRLREVRDWTARTWTFGYDAAGNLTSKVNPLNQTLTYTYDTAKHLLTGIVKPVLRDGQSVKTQFKYYENGRTFQQTNSFGQGDTLDYDLYRKSTRVTDARGGVREYFYDDNGRMTQLTEPDGAVLLFENQADAIRSKKYDALGYATTYSYRADRAFTGNADTFGNVTREQDALNRTVDLTYGPLDQTATAKDKRGTVSTTSYATSTGACDYNRRPRETRLSALSGSANVLLSSACWNSNATLNTSRIYLDASHYRETRLTYEPGSNGLNVSQEQIVGMPANITTTKTYTYDSLGHKSTETLLRRTSPTNAAPVSLTTTYEYDALDRVTKTTDSLGNEAINNYDANGQLWQVTHRYRAPSGSYQVRNVLTRTFDAADRVKTQADAAGNLTRTTYDEAGNVIAVTDAESHTTRFEYDAMNRRTAVVDATGYRTESAYNLRGEVTRITDANNETLGFEYDALGRKTAVVDARGYRSEFQYDENGNLTCTIDANAQAGLQPRNARACSESREYDELNRVTKIIDARDGETRFAYDLTGNRRTLTDAENKPWGFAYDDQGRLASETDHNNQPLSYKTDEAGNVYEKTNRLGQITRYTYDNGNRLTRVDYLADGTSETFGYDPAGNRSAAANATVSYQFQYDNLNRLFAKNDNRGRSMSFGYDRVGNLLTKFNYDSSTTAYQYNAANRLVQLSNPDYLQMDYQYDPAGRLLSRVSSAGARSTYQYDANGTLNRLSQYDAANALISDTSYTRDRVGNILTRADSTGTTSYVYDALYRLKTADLPGSANDEAFAYDKVGNRTQVSKGSLVANASTRFYNYQANTNRLLDIRIGSTTGSVESSFVHDNEGRLSSQTGVGAKAPTWDAKGRMKTLNGETYRYDPMDYRIGRTGGALGNLDYFLEGEHLESVYSGANLQAKYLRGASTDELVAGYQIDSADGKLKPYLFHHDNLTSTTAVSGHNGGAIQTNTFSAFGSTLASTGASPNRLKYTGREDDNTGLYYYRARYYDPVVGRFISEDPLGFAAGVNFYAYVNNNPINANDPSGLVPYVRYDTRDEAHAQAGRWNASQTLGMSNATGLHMEFGAYVYQNGAGGFSHTPSVSSFFRAANGSATVSETAWGSLQSLIPPGAGGITRDHSHPSPEAGFRQTPSPEDWAGTIRLGTGLFDSVSRQDGSVWGYRQVKGATSDGAGGISIGVPINPDPTRLAPASPLTPYSFMDRSEPDFTGAAGGFLLYPNKPNNNSTVVVYRK